MNILHHTSLYFPDHCSGGERMLHEYLVAMRERGHSVAVVRFRSKPYTYDGIEVIGENDGLADAYGWADIVVTHLSAAGSAYNACRRWRKPMVYVVHNSTENPHVSMHRWIGVVYNSYNLEATFRDIYRQRSVVCRPIARAWQPLDEIGDAVTIVNHNENKGGRLFAQLADENRDLHWIAVKGYGRQVRMPDNVEVVGNTDDIMSVYRRTRVVLMPSEKESYGRTAAEALMLGIPVLVHPTAGLTEVVDGNPAVMVDRRNPMDWNDALLDVYSVRGWEMLRNFARIRGDELRAQVPVDVARFEEYLKFKTNENPYVTIP